MSRQGMLICNSSEGTNTLLTGFFYLVKLVLQEIARWDETFLKSLFSVHYFMATRIN